MEAHLATENNFTSGILKKKKVSSITNKSSSIPLCLHRRATVSLRGVPCREDHFLIIRYRLMPIGRYLLCVYSRNHQDNRVSVVSYPVFSSIHLSGNNFLLFSPISQQIMLY